MCEIKVIKENSNQYINEAWNIKKNINNESGLLKQKWMSFQRIYSDSVVFIIFNDVDSMVGYACVDKDDIYDNNYLSLLAINPEHQRMGFGYELIETIKEKYNYVFCHARINNTQAYNFYLSNGFEKVENVESYYQNGDGAYLLEYMNENADIQLNHVF